MLGSFLSKAGDKLIDFVVTELTTSRPQDFGYILVTLQRSVNSLRKRALDIDEQIRKAELLGKKKRKREVEDWLEQVQIMESELRALENEVESEGFVSRFLGGDRPAKLKERVDGLVKQSRHFGGFVLDDFDIRGEALLTPKMVGKAFEENFERIWKFLVTDRVPSIGIYGMGGVGKTTLTKHIHNQLLNELTQECVFWVTVSQGFNIKMLQDNIAHVIKLDLSDEHDEDKRAAKLNKALSKIKNFILILDDVWEDISLEKVGDPLCIEGSQLIITTRSLKICHQIGCQHRIKVETLVDDEAWKLFSETLGQETTLNDPQVQEIAKSMVKVCDGLPLGIVTLAGSMRGETAIYVWRDAMEELQESTMGQEDMDLKVFKVLKYSFDRLDTVSQLCFLYCSLYPEDTKIPQNELVRRFISEELVKNRKRMKAQLDMGNSVLDKLVNVCLLESIDDDDGEDCVKMHDLVRSMALKITEGKTKVIAGNYGLKEIPNEEEWTKDLEKMSLMNNDIKEIPCGISPNCPKLSTLLLQWNQSLHYIADSFFSQMRGLRTLDLSGTRIKELPNSLSDLESLQALILDFCQFLEYVPDLGKLKELRELDLSSTSIKKVPQGMEKLVNAKSLSMRKVHDLEMFPTGLLPNLRKLQCLHLPYEIETPIEDIERLKELEEFEGRFKDVCDFNRFIQSQQNKLYPAFYRIQVGKESWEEDEDLDAVAEDINYSGVFFCKIDLKKEVTVLVGDIDLLIFDSCEGLSKCLSDDFNIPNSLKILYIKKCEGVECIPQLLFSSLKQLRIRDCTKMKKLGILGLEFPNLETLSIRNCPEIEEIIEDEDSTGEGETPILNRIVSLPKLKQLNLTDLPRLKSICKATIMCNSIEYIQLGGCPALKKVPLYFPRDFVDGPYSPPPALVQIFLEADEEEWWESLEWEHPTHIHLLEDFIELD